MACAIEALSVAFALLVDRIGVMDSTGLTLVVLAAGVGRRFGGIKQMEPVGPSGEFIIDYSIYDAVAAGFSKIVFVISSGIEADFRSVVGSRMASRVAIEYAIQSLDDLPQGFAVPVKRNKPWGTGHALLAAGYAIDAPFAVINADDFYGRDSFFALAEFLGTPDRSEDAHCMVGFRLCNTLSPHGSVARGICTGDNRGKLKSIVERTSITVKGGVIECPEQVLQGDEVVSMNMWGFQPAVVPRFEKAFSLFLRDSLDDVDAEFFMPTVVDTLIAEEQASVEMLRSDCEWFGVTYADDKEIAVERINKLVAEGAYPQSLWP